MRWIERWSGVIVAVFLVVAAIGCSRDPGGLLDRMSEAYRAADRYSDGGTVRIQYIRGETLVDHEIPFRVAFERPDRLRVECYDAQVVCDGGSLHAAVGDVPGQVLVEQVKTPLSLEQLFADPHLRSRMSEGEAGCPTQLPLLLADDTVGLILAEAVGNPRFAGGEQIEGHACTKVEVDKPDGTLTLWIDDASSILRRLSLPSKAYAAFLASQVGPVSKVEVVAEFKNASFDAPIAPAAFAFEVPRGARTVRAIEPVQSPDPPSDLLGKASPPFTLAAIDGASVSRESLAGSPAVLEFFFEGCGPCSRSMPRVRQAVERLRSGGRKVAHHRVSVDDAEVADETIREFVAKADGGKPDAAKPDAEVPILRDPRSVAAGAFGVATFPAVVVLAPDGTVADLRSGPDHRVGEDLVAVVEAAASGKPTAEIVQRRFDRRLAEYRAAIDTATGGGAAAIPEQVIAPKRQPDRFKLVRAWKTDAVALPGNIVRVEPREEAGGGQASLFVLDGWRAVVELGVDGAEISRHDVDIPKEASLGFLRTAVDRDGRRWWLAGAVGGQHLFVFDERWRRQAVYPEIGSGPHAGVSAAELVDLEGDGSPEIVAGFFGSVGIHGVGLDGRRLWKERSIDTAIHLSADAPGEDGRRGVVVVDGRGRIVRVGPDGLATTPVSVGGRVQTIHGGPVGVTQEMEPTWSLLAIAGESLGRTRLVGLARDLTVKWNHDLPDGIHRDGPIEPVGWADLLGSRRRQWLVAAPDGSVTILWDDGGIVGRYAHGEPIVGLTGFVAGGQPHLVVATRTAVEALRMEDIALD